MSSETIEWLNNFTLIGHTDKRDKAWHYRAASQGDEPNHYPGAIPVEDVVRRLFNWQAEEASISATVLNENGVYTVPASDRKAIVRPPKSLSEDDPGGILGLFKSTYTVHQYDEWLLHQVADMLDDDLNIGSAGLLKMGGQAWVQIEVPDNITTPSGVVFRPNLLACTSHDGTLQTTFKRQVTNVVCDNTMSVALGEAKDQQIKVKHSKYSDIKLKDAREALAIVHTISDDFAKQVEQLTNTPVSDGDWDKFLSAWSPVAEEEGRAQTVAMRKHDAMQELWDLDPRVAPWSGTAYGVVQAVNTYAHHVSQAHGGKNAARNMARAVSGGVEKLDAETLSILNKVLA